MARPRNSIAALGFAIAWAVTPAFGDELGTLFHTPRERADLEKLRRGESIRGQGGASFARPDPVVTGYVKRSDGKSTVFVDGQPYPIRNEKLQDQLEPRTVQKNLPPLPPVPPPAVEAPAAAPATPRAAGTPESRSGDRPRT